MISDMLTERYFQVLVTSMCIGVSRNDYQAGPSTDALIIGTGMGAAAVFIGE